MLIDDDANLNPYELQVPGNHTPPKVTDIATSLYQAKEGGLLDIIPATMDLMYIALGQANAKTGPIEERFEKFIAECRDKYDLIVIDCHPAGSLFTKTSLRNSDHVLIPVMPQRYAVRGIGLMLDFIGAKKVGADAATPHIIFNGMPRVGITPQEAQIRANANFTSFCLINTLKRYKAFSEPEGGRGFVWASNKPYSWQAFLNLYRVTEEFLTRVGA